MSEMEGHYKLQVGTTVAYLNHLRKRQAHLAVKLLRKVGTLSSGSFTLRAREYEHRHGMQDLPSGFRFRKYDRPGSGRSAPQEVLIAMVDDLAHIWELLTGDSITISIRSAYEDDDDLLVIEDDWP